jgi:hypothetical protein
MALDDNRAVKKRALTISVREAELAGFIYNGIQYHYDEPGVGRVMSLALAEKQGFFTWPTNGYRYYADNGDTAFFLTSDDALDFSIKISQWLDEVRQAEFRVLGDLDAAADEAELNNISATISISEESRGAG